MELWEKQISSQEIFDGRVIHVVFDRVALPDGGESTREVAYHPAGVAVLAVTDEEDRAMLGAVLEATAHYSNELVRPAYYESALSERFLQDARSRRALDDLYENIAFDYCFVENVGEVRNSLRGILSSPSSRVSAYHKRWEKSVKSDLAKYMRNLDELQ